MCLGEVGVPGSTVTMSINVPCPVLAPACTSKDLVPLLSLPVPAIP